MYFDEMVNNVAKYCGLYHGHDSMIDERTSGSFNIKLPEEIELREKIDELNIVILTGEAGDGKTRMIKNLGDQLNGFIIVNDFSELNLDDRNKVLTDISKILNGETSGKMIIAANVGILTKNIIQYNFALMNQLASDARVKIYNFERRSLSDNREIFYNIIEDFLCMNTQLECSKVNCECRENCVFRANYEAISSNNGIESVLTLCEAIYLTGGHITFRELLSLLSFMVTGGYDCNNHKEAEIQGVHFTKIFENDEDILLKKFVAFDPANKPSDLDNLFHSSFEEYKKKKREAFFSDNNDRLALLSIDYIKEFKDTISFLDKEPFFSDAQLCQNYNLINLKEGLSKVLFQNDSDLGFYISDTPSILGDDIKTEFELDINTIDLLWNRFDLDFNNLNKVLDPQKPNCFALSFVRVNLDNIAQVIQLQINYSVFNFLMKAKNDYFLSKKDNHVEQFELNTFFRKILEMNPETYQKVKIIFNEKKTDYVNFSLEIFKPNKFLSSKDNYIKIKKA